MTSMTALLRNTRRTLIALLLVLPAVAPAQERRDEQFYYPGGFNWLFLKTYPEAARLFNAFDYGHAVLYERLLTRTAAEAPAALEKEFRYLTTDLLIRPPRFAVAEEVIEPAYAKLAWQAKQMFDWAHVLHRQIYDVYADERLSPAERDRLIERLTDYYLTRKEYAFTAAPKSMALMDEQYFSQVFRKRHPKFNGLIWAYHWLQVGLYEPLIAGQTAAEKKAGVKATLARFWSMLENPPNQFPKVMPMTSAIAPQFSAAHPRAAVIFDNLHMMHDIISDILAADTIPAESKRSVIYQQLEEFRDSSRNVMSMDEWRNMGEMMGGVGAMGGPAVGLLTETSAGDSAGGHAGMRHGAAARDTARPAAPEHQHHQPTPPPASAAGEGRSDSAAVADVIERFHAALAAGDSNAALALLAPDVTILESGGVENLEEYRSHHLPGDIAFARAVSRARTPITVRLAGEAAWATSTGTTQGEFRGRSINSTGAELVVLSRSERGWLIRAIHWSSRPRR
jgi:hypothetical protein